MKSASKFTASFDSDFRELLSTYQVENGHKRGWRRALAAKLGITESQLSHAANGRPVGAVMLMRMREVMGVNVPARPAASPNALALLVAHLKAADALLSAGSPEDASTSIGRALAIASRLGGEP